MGKNWLAWILSSKNGNQYDVIKLHGLLHMRFTQVRYGKGPTAKSKIRELKQTNAAAVTFKFPFN